MSYDLAADWPRLAAAIDKAPSVFNTKPWLFHCLPPEHVELRLPGLINMSQPLERESVISCGAALYNLRLAIRAAGHDLDVWLMPRPHDRELLALVEVVVGRIKQPAPRAQGLYAAIPGRRTNRWPYVLPAPLPIIEAMEAAAVREGAHLRLLDPRQARKWMRVTADVDKVFTAHFPNHVNHANYGPCPTNRYGATRRDFWRRDQQRFERSPQLLALSTDDDTTADWLAAGQALQSALLTGTLYSRTAEYGFTARYRAPVHGPRRGFPTRQHPLTGPDEVAPFGLSTSFLTQKLEYDDLRHEPRRWPWRWPFAEVPQMIIRVGYARVEPDGTPAPSGPAHA